MSQKKLVLPGKNAYNVEYMLVGFPGLANVRIGHDEVSNDEVWLYPSQALALLAWLQQEREELERLAKDEKHEP